MDKTDPRLIRLAELLAEHDTWVASRGGDDPADGAEKIATGIINFLVQSGLNGSFDYLVQHKMRQGYHNDPPPLEDEAECERALLRGKAKLLEFVVRLVPDAFGPAASGVLIDDVLSVIKGEQPLLGGKIPFANRQQLRPSMARNMLGRAILWAYYHAARDNAPGGWKAVFKQFFGLYKDSTLEEYKAFAPREDRELSRTAGKARVQGAPLTPAQEEIEKMILRVPPEELRDQLSLAVRGNNWRDIPAG